MYKMKNAQDHNRHDRKRRRALFVANTYPVLDG